MGKSAHTATELQRIVAGDVVYDMLRQSLRHGEKEAALTLAGSKMLLCLLGSRGRPVPSDELLLRALGAVHSRRTTAVETAICRLRRKLRAVGAGAAIRTVRHEGYTID